MHIREFCNGIQLGEAASRNVADYCMNERDYTELRRHFQTDRHAFFQHVTGVAGYRQQLLYLFVRLAIDVYEEYRVRGIADNVYFDTFSDIRIWSEVCYRDYGEYGIEEYNWLQEHVRLRLFRLGRLQFQPIAIEGDLKAGGLTVEKNQLVLNVHIPEGDPLAPQEVVHSFSLARAFFRGIPSVFVCQSWLLYTGLDQILKADSNILQFQRLFQIYEIDEASKEAEQRIFNRVAADPSEYGEETSLQRAAKAYLQAGGRLGRGSGIYVPV
ncbi:acyltransferase domain-containing protein [Paenibacillus sp. NPDC057967]|uniref:acyltransferase domain-containing protein n=1 Tax=Paenibacillus sp. NPDC057967 TaxID=3346293 RepID=UPI0036D9EBBF